MTIWCDSDRWNGLLETNGTARNGTSSSNAQMSSLNSVRRSSCMASGPPGLSAQQAGRTHQQDDHDQHEQRQSALRAAEVYAGVRLDDADDEGGQRGAADAAQPAEDDD